MNRPTIKTALGIALALALVPAASATAATSSFTYTGAEQSFTVPAGVSSVRVVAVGGRGGSSTGGLGARVSGDLSVSPGQVLFVEVGESGSPTTGVFSPATFNGGGSGSLGAGSGGGASDLRGVSRVVGGSLSSRLMVAAGGGGGTNGGDVYGGDGGAAGAPGEDGAGLQKGKGGGAGTPSGGGAGGNCCPAGAAGTLGSGGAGGSGNPGGAGGGGGYYGGGGGGGGGNESYGAGGGGGSSFTGSATGASVAADTTGTPSITISYTAAVAGTGGTNGTLGSTADKTKPALGTLSFSTTTFAAAKSGAAFGSQKKRRNVPIGTKVSFNLSEASSVKFTVQRKTTGRRVAGKCKTKKKSNAKKRKCTLWKNVTGSFTVAGKAGKNTFTFRGRIGGKKLRTGSYRLNGTATDPSKNASLPRQKGFKIVK